MEKRNLGKTDIKLTSIGFLQGYIVKKGKESFLIVERRSPKLELLASNS